MPGSANGHKDDLPEPPHPLGWKHIPKLHTCQHCDKIVITHHQLKHGLVSLPQQTRLEALQAEADGCPIFKMLNGSWHLIARDRRPTALVSSFRFLSDSKYLGECHSMVGSMARSPKLSTQSKSQSKKIAMLLWKTRHVLDSLRRRHFYLRVNSDGIDFLDGSTVIECDGFLKIIEGREGAIDADEDLSRHVLRRRFDSERNYADLKTFASNCLSSHEACRILSMGFVPSRLLEINPDSGPNHIRLVETTPGKQWTWACLSYVWGGDQRHKTTKSLLPEYLKDIYLEELPRTIKDAVSVYRGLNISYLWIDSFCIVQDDKLDKTREIPQMASIYRHALLTIAAACAHNVDEGFLHNLRPLCYRQLAPTALRYRDRDGSKSKVFVLTEKNPGAPPHTPREPIDTRAWALQEQLLSPRLLSYSSHGPLWSCRSLRTLVDRSQHQDSMLRYSGALAEFQSHWDDFLPVPCIPGLEMQSWETVVQIYSARKVTLHSDKLVALSAVAQIYRESNQDYGTYLAGIWENSIPKSLLWRAFDRYGPRPRPPEYTAPSWSWASVVGTVQYHTREEALEVDADFELIGAQTRLVNSNVFGAVMQGTLIMNARVRHCRVERRHSLSDHRISGGPEIMFKADIIDPWPRVLDEGGPWISLFDDATLLLLAFTPRVACGLVLVKTTSSDSFSREGYFEFLTDDSLRIPESSGVSDEFFQGFKTERVTIV